MSAVASKGTSLEDQVNALLEAIGHPPGERWLDQLPGKPDFGWPNARVVLFAHSCFWHACPEHCRAPKSRKEYWDGKLAANRQRDQEVRAQLESQGWTVIVLWEHDLKKETIEKTANHLQDRLDSLLGNIG